MPVNSCCGIWRSLRDEDMDRRLKKELAGCLKRPVQWNQPLAGYTTFGVGGPAAALAVVENNDELAALQSFVEREGLAWRVLGGGSNLLVRDEGFDGVAVLLEGDFAKHRIRLSGDGVKIEAGAATRLPKLLAICLRRGYAGLEFSAGIPGSLGGAVVMNAGAWGSTIADVLECIDVMGPRGLTRLEAARLEPQYRKMNIPVPQPCVVVSATLALESMDPVDLHSRYSSYLRQRRLRQPKAAGSAGSVFKNPEGDSAGRLIEASGLKGLQVGGAEVSPLHANFIVNRGGARAEDILRLMERIQRKVAADSGIFLDPEVHIL